MSDPDRWHDGPGAIAHDWTVPCEYCGGPATEENSCAEIVAKKPGTETVLARRAWCDKPACWDDMLSGFGRPAGET